MDFYAVNRRSLQELIQSISQSRCPAAVSPSPAAPCWRAHLLPARSTEPTAVAPPAHSQGSPRSWRARRHFCPGSDGHRHLWGWVSRSRASLMLSGPTQRSVHRRHGDLGDCPVVDRGAEGSEVHLLEEGVAIWPQGSVAETPGRTLGKPLQLDPQCLGEHTVVALGKGEAFSVSAAFSQRWSSAPDPAGSGSGSGSPALPSAAGPRREGAPHAACGDQESPAEC